LVHIGGELPDIINIGKPFKIENVTIKSQEDYITYKTTHWKLRRYLDENMKIDYEQYCNAEHGIISHVIGEKADLYLNDFSQDDGVLDCMKILAMSKAIKQIVLHIEYTKDSPNKYIKMIEITKNSSLSDIRFELVIKL
jgi:hypothetical protein